MKSAVFTLIRFLNLRWPQILFLASWGFMVFLAFSYSLCWQDFDVPHNFHRQALKNGPALQWEDLIRIFNSGPDGYQLGPPTRLRYVNHLFSLFDIKFRIWLFNYIPPHPSVSLMWLFVLFLSPLMMFKLAYELTGRRQTAWIATALFVLSTGNLFGINKLANPAKPLANFFGLSLFFLAAVIDRQLRSDSRLSPRSRRLYLLMLAVLAVALFTDETTWLFYLVIPLLFPALFTVRPARRFCIVGYLVLLASAVFMVFAGFPYLVDTFTPGGATVDYFLEYGGGPDAGPTLPGFFGPRYLLLTGRNLLWTQLVPWGWFWNGILFLGLLSAYLVVQYRGLEAPDRRLVMRFAGGIAIFVCFQSLAIAKVYWEEGYVLKYSLYYGSLLAVFLPIPLAILLSRDDGRWRKVVNRLLLLFLAVMMVYNFSRINEDIRFLQALWENAGEMDYATSRAIWRERRDPEAIGRFKARYPAWSAWAYIQEIEIVAKQHTDKPKQNLTPGWE